MPKAKLNRGVQVIWTTTDIEGRTAWQGCLYSRRKLISWAILFIDVKHPDRIWLDSVQTLPEYRRQGYATTVMQSMINMMRMEYKEVDMIIQPFGEETMTTARLTRFYQKMGFTKTDRTLLGGQPIWELKL